MAAQIPPKDRMILRLRVADFDVDTWQRSLDDCARSGIRFHSLAELGDNETNRRRLHELNKELSANIPGDVGTFDSFEQHRAERLEVDAFNPSGVFLVLDGNSWVGVAMVSQRKPDLAFNEMTGVLRAHRRRGIVTNRKVLSFRFAQSLSVTFLDTSNAAESGGVIAMNRSLGYVDRV